MIQRNIPEMESKSAPPDALLAQLEALLFVAREPLPARKMAELLGEDAAAVEDAVAHLREHRFGIDASGVQLVEIAGGWRLLTHPACADAVAALAGKKAQDRLSTAALETLAIIAYKQPVSRAEIERVRGVGVGPILRHLLELDLIRVSGREEGIGRALLYGTTRQFLDRFGLKDVRDLPASLEF
jgi:segregation and condensation protein B